MQSRLVACCLISLLSLPICGFGQQPERARVYRNSIDLQFFGEAESYAWYRVATGPSSYEFVLVDTNKGTRAPAFDHTKLAGRLSDSLGKSISGENLPLSGVRFSDDLDLVLFRAEGKNWQWSRTSDTLSESDGDESASEHAGGLQPLNYVARSGNGEPTEIEIFNNTDAELIVYWIDQSGQRHSYGSIRPGESFASSTYITHAWLLTDLTGNRKAAFQAGMGENVAYVTNETPVPELGRGPNGRSDRRNNRLFGNNSERISPDESWAVFFRGNNVVLRNRVTDREVQLTTDGSEEDGFGGRVYWAPNSQHFVVLKTKRAKQRQITMIDSAPDDSLQPKVVTVDYTKPGDELDRPIPYLFHFPEQAMEELGDESPTQLAIRVNESLFPNPFEMNNYRWSEDSSEFTFVYNQRGHQVLRVVSIDAATGGARSVIDETSDTFVCYSQKFFYERLDETNEILWMTERDGWNHIILVDSRTGEVKNRVTSGNWVVREVERVDPVNRQIWLKISGYHVGLDPYYIHLARVNFDGTGFTLLTDGDGTHNWRFSPEALWLIDSYSRVDMPPVTTLRNVKTGELVCELERADMSALQATGWQPPQRFVAKGRDGVTDIYGIIVRPTDFDATKKYPVLEAIYAGPHSSFTPKSFGRHGDLYDMADRGFIIVKLDGMGTSDRSKAFHDVCWKNLGDSGFPDRIAWMKAAAVEYPELDIERVGIWGGSAGGQSALRALLGFGDFYDAAAADCGCHDNRMDKIWWNEQWMGWPIGAHYEEQSNVTQAHRLTGKLLLTVGELDRNVDPASTMQVVDALIRADKDFELIVFPGAGHGIGSGKYGTRRMQDFFIRSLGGPVLR